MDLLVPFCGNIFKLKTGLCRSTKMLFFPKYLVLLQACLQAELEKEFQTRLESEKAKFIALDDNRAVEEQQNMTMRLLKQITQEKDEVKHFFGSSCFSNKSVFYPPQIYHYFVLCLKTIDAIKKKLVVTNCRPTESIITYWPKDSNISNLEPVNLINTTLNYFSQRPNT